MAYHAKTSSDITAKEIKHMELVRKLAGECIVILKNDDVLPVSAGKIAVYGNGARHYVKGGTGSGDVNSRFNVPVEEGLIRAGFEVTNKSWLDRFDADLEVYTRDYLKMIDEYTKARKIAPEMGLFDNPFGVMEQPEVTDADIDSETELALFVITRDAGEGKDREYKRGDYLLTETEESNLKKIASSYKKTAVIINAGGIIDTSVINSIEGVGAILTVSQLGNLGGDIIADAVSGKITPSGKLTDTWAKRYEDYPNHATFSKDDSDEVYGEGIYVGYRYFDSFGIEPMYPFGFGLSYTTFDTETVATKLDGSRITITCKVTNTGSKFSGKEVVQAYCSAPEGNIDKPFKVLVGYAKTSCLAPGGSEEVDIVFDIREAVSYDAASAQKVLEEGDYLIRVGTSSADNKVVMVVNVPGRIVTANLKNLFAPDMEISELTNPGKGRALHEASDREQTAGLEKFVLDIDQMPEEDITYTDERDEFTAPEGAGRITLNDVMNGEADLKELIAQLTPEEMAYLCVGAFEGNRKDDSAVGAQSTQVPGAAAETTAYYLESRGIPSLVLADGPAGLRLQPHFKSYPDGSLVPGGYVFGFFKQDFPSDLPDGCTDYYQYCTAIPIATALAQSWNPGLIAEMGYIVGEEMIDYNVHLWLAPGMNIHRNPLCGRNFEYYSEDPLISGKCAAAMTIGVQKNKGRGTTIKHFSGNNQEDNRLFSNSHVTEKTMREIYLRGFEIAVKASQPLAVMTSYNLLNGTHTANNYDLIQNVLRDEWGYKGVVMTDWFTTSDAVAAKGFGHPEKYGPSSSALCMHAGNDWIMPGEQADITDILDSIEDGSLALADLQSCVYNILKTCIICTGD